MDMNVEVKNLHNTGDRKPVDGSASWKDFWEGKTGRKFGKCACISCFRKATDGGHVTRCHVDRSWYITPLCKEHNNPYYNESYVVDSDDLVAVR